MLEENNVLMVVEQKEVVFYDDGIVAVRVADGIVYVPVRPICSLLGVDWAGQRRRINRDAVLSEVMRSVDVTSTEGTRIVTRQMLCLPLEYLNGFLFGINADRVKSELKERVIRYQRECYKILADAFIDRPVSDDWMRTSPETIAALQQIRENALAVANLAEEQIRMMMRLDNAAIVIGRYGKRITALEQKLAPREAITDEQAADVSAKVMSIATEMTELDPSKNHYQSIFRELHRRFRVTSYKNIRQGQYQAVLDFLDTWADAGRRDEVE